MTEPMVVRLHSVSRRFALLLALIPWLSASELHAQDGSATDAAARAAQYQRMIHNGERDGLPSSKMGYMWALLGSAYQDANIEDKAVDAYQRALRLLGTQASDRGNYAATLDNLGSLYLEYGEVEQAESVRRQALAVRKELGDPVEVARTAQHVAEVTLARHRYKEAEQEARNALETLAPSEEGLHPHAMTELASLVTLSYAECMQGKKRGEGLRVAQRLERLAAEKFPPPSLPYAHALMALGFAQWKNGFSVEAERNMVEGIRQLRAHSGEASPVVTEALFEYRGFLKALHRDGEMEAVDRQIAARMPLGSMPCRGCTVSAYALR